MLYVITCLTVEADLKPVKLQKPTNETSILSSKYRTNNDKQRYSVVLFIVYVTITMTNKGSVVFFIVYKENNTKRVGVVINAELHKLVKIDDDTNIRNI